MWYCSRNSLTDVRTVLSPTSLKEQRSSSQSEICDADRSGCSFNHSKIVSRYGSNFLFLVFNLFTQSTVLSKSFSRYEYTVFLDSSHFLEIAAMLNPSFFN